MPLLAWLLLSTSASAQMFGPRTLGGSLSRQPQPGTAPQPSPSAGAMSGNPNANLLNSFETGMARFFRENRDRSSFVGRDRRDVQGFVGMTQAENVGPIESATGNLRIQQSPEVNRRMREPTTSRPAPYRPRLSLGFNAPRPAALEKALAGRLDRSLGSRLQAPVGVRLEGRTAILEGEVASEHDRALAAQLMLLEPGVSRVENRLQVAGSSPPIAPPKPAQVPEPPQPEVAGPSR
jgi:hypothetical protein